MEQTVTSIQRHVVPSSIGILIAAWTGIAISGSATTDSPEARTDTIQEIGERPRCTVTGRGRGNLHNVMRDVCCILGLIIVSSARGQDVHVHVSPASKGTTASTDDFPTIQMALDHAPDPGPGARLYLHIAPGVYRERVYVSPLRPRTTLLGTGSDPSQVVITADKNAGAAGGTFFSETVEVVADGFQADNVTFENTAGPTGQAVAISVSSDRAVFKHCRFLGDQDTLFTNYGRQFYTDAYISGGVDFIFGNATAYFTRSEIHELRPGYLTAQSRTSRSQTTGFVFRDVRISAGDLGDKSFFLGRPWRAFSRVVFLESEMPATLNAQGWSAWRHGEEPESVFYAEYRSKGPGANPQARVPWSHQLSLAEAKHFQPREFLGGTDHWDAEADAARLP